MRENKFDLIVVGHLLKEKIIFPDGKEIGPALGSPCAYISVAAARLGLKTGIVTKIGEDMPEELLKVFSETGVDTTGIRKDKNTTSNLLIYRKDGSKNLKFLKKASDILFKDIPSNYLNTDWFIISPIDYEVPVGLIKSLYKSGKKLSMELGGFGGASSNKDSRFPQEKRLNYLKHIVPYFEIIKGGREDCRTLFGSQAIDEKTIAKKFIEWGAKVSVITLGEEGALGVTRKRFKTTDGHHNFTFCQMSCYPSRVIDCTGAGDVFHAGFIAEYLKTANLEDSIRSGLASASCVIEKTGGATASRMPTQKQVRLKIRT